MKLLTLEWLSLSNTEFTENRIKIVEVGQVRLGYGNMARQYLEIVLSLQVHQHC